MGRRARRVSVRGAIGQLRGGKRSSTEAVVAVDKERKLLVRRQHIRIDLSHALEVCGHTRIVCHTDVIHHIERDAVNLAPGDVCMQHGVPLAVVEHRLFVYVIRVYGKCRRLRNLWHHQFINHELLDARRDLLEDIRHGRSMLGRTGFWPSWKFESQHLETRSKSLNLEL